MAQGLKISLCAQFLNVIPRLYRCPVPSLVRKVRNLRTDCVNDKAENWETHKVKGCFFAHLQRDAKENVLGCALNFEFIISHKN